MSINLVALTGNLTRDMDLRTTGSGKSIGNFSIAVNDRRKSPDTGEWEDKPNFVDCVLFGKRAEALDPYMLKGQKVALQGKLSWSQWEKDGQKRSKLDVIVDDIELIGGKKSEKKEESYDPYPDDIPF